MADSTEPQIPLEPEEPSRIEHPSVVNVSQKREIPPERLEKLRENAKKALQTKAKYKKIREELGLGARDPIPTRYLDRKEYKPVVYSKAEPKITAGEDHESLRREVHEIKLKKKQQYEDEPKRVKRELKENRMREIVRNEMESVITQKEQRKIAFRESEVRKKTRAEESQKLRFRSRDGRVLEF